MFLGPEMNLNQLILDTSICSFLNKLILVFVDVFRHKQSVFLFTWKQK